jgi:hypothetical protein
MAQEVLRAGLAQTKLVRLYSRTTFHEWFTSGRARGDGV